MTGQVGGGRDGPGQHAYRRPQRVPSGRVGQEVRGQKIPPLRSRRPAGAIGLSGGRQGPHSHRHAVFTPNAAIGSVALDAPNVSVAPDAVRPQFPGSLADDLDRCPEIDGGDDEARRDVRPAAGRLAGVARAGAGAAAGTVRSMGTRISGGLSESAQQGRDAAWQATGGNSRATAGNGVAVTPSDDGGAPAWARRLRAEQRRRARIHTS